MLFGMLLLFNSFLDGLNMTVSDSKSVKRNWIKNGLVRFTMFFVVFAILFLAEGKIDVNLVLVFSGVLGIIIIIIETIFSSRYKSFFKRFKSALSKFFYKQFLVYLGLALFITIIFQESSLITYAILFGVLITVSILVYLVVFKWLALRFFKQIPYEMPFDDKLYQIEPGLKNNLYVIQSKKIYLPMNALLMGVFKTKKVLMTPPLLGGLNSAQVQAIITHEIGHYHLKHLLIRLFVLIGVFVSYLGIAYLVFDTPLMTWLALEVTLLSQVTILSVFIYILENILETLFYRLAHIQEYQADQYAAKHGYAIPLSTALEVIDKRQGEVSMHSLYHTLKLSHPKTDLRIKRLREYG